MSRRLPKRQCLNKSANTTSKDYTPEPSSQWTLVEKQNLVSSIKSYGLSDMEKLATVVKTRSAAEIKAYLHKNRKRLLKTYNEEMRSRNEDDVGRNQILVKWGEKMREAVDIRQRGKDYSNVLEQVFKAAGKEEEDMDRRPDEPNFSLIYSYLSTALCGNVPPVLPPLESWLILHAWQSLSEVLKQPHWLEEKNFLKCLPFRALAPLDPQFQKLNKENLWKLINDMQSSRNGTASNSANVQSNEDVHSAPAYLNNSQPSTSIENKLSMNVPIDHCYVSTSNAQGHSGKSGNSLVHIAMDYPIYDTFKHAHGLVLTSLNPLTVPVAMLKKENKIIFGQD